MQKVVIIGPDSYLATGLNAYLTDCHVQHLYFHNWSEHIAELKSADCVVNFSISPDFSMKDVDVSDVLDVQIARELKDTKARFVFISSRKVYGSTDECVTHEETDELKGIDFYSNNKIRTERALQEILQGNLTILRVSNIVGEPVLRNGYKTFIGWICQSIAEKGILEVTENEEAVKDFITKEFLHKNIASVIKNKIVGTYNLSAGFGTAIKDILTGYVGAENVRFLGQSLSPKDQFVLNNSKLISKTNVTLSSEQISQYLADCRTNLLRLTHKNSL